MRRANPDADFHLQEANGYVEQAAHDLARANELFEGGRDAEAWNASLSAYRWAELAASELYNVEISEGHVPADTVASVSLMIATLRPSLQLRLSGEIDDARPASMLNPRERAVDWRCPCELT